MSSVQVHGLSFQCNSPQHFHPNGTGLYITEILKPSPVYLKIIRGKHSVTSLSCKSFTLTEMLCMRAGQQCNTAPESGLLGHPALLVTAGLQQPPDTGEEFSVAYKEWSLWENPQTAPGRGKCHHQSASEESCRQEAPSWLNCFSPTFGAAHPEAAAGGKGGCVGFPWGSTYF